MKTSMRLMLALAGLLCLPAFPSVRANSVVVRVPERAGVNRDNEFCSWGLPLPIAWQVTNAAQLRLLNAQGAPIAAQFEVLARWGGAPTNAAQPAKWILVSTIDSLAANTEGVYALENTGPGPGPAIPIVITTPGPNRLRVDTGAAQFDLNTAAFNLLEQVTVGGQPVLDTLTSADAIRYQDMDGTSIVPGGAPNLTPRTVTAVVEKSGPLHAVIRITGSILDASARPALDYTARLHFYAGRAEARLDFTVENNHPIIPDIMGQPQNAHSQGAINSVYVGDLALCLRPRNNGAPVRVLTERSVDVSSPAASVRLYQESSGTNNWDAYVGSVGWPGEQAPAAPRLQSYCAYRGYRITGAGSTLSGDQALGWMTATRAGTAGPAITVAVRDFWQNFPKALETMPDGTLAVHLFPNGRQFRHNFRVGEEKTHTLLLRFGLGAPAAAEAERLARAFNRPLFGQAQASWYINSGALGEAPKAELSVWPLYERYVRTAFEPNPDFNPAVDDPNLGNRTLREMIEWYNLYGWQDYGDVPLDFEAFGPRQAGQMNLKYWFAMGLLVQFCRSAEPRWLDLIRPALWHLADVDILHIPDSGPAHWAHGAYFGHSQHDERGNTNPNRNYNSPSVDLFFAIPDLFLGYCLTGERRFRDAAMEGLEGISAEAEFADFTTPYLWRERAMMMMAYLEAYRQTGSARWLNNLRTVVAATANLADKPWLTNPNAWGAAHPGDAQRMFMFSMVAWALGRYLDFTQEYALTDDLGAAAALAAFGNFAIQYATQEYAPGRAAHPYDYVFDHSAPADLDINNWALLMADVLAYAYKYTGTRAYLDAAAKYYATGTIDPVWPGDPPVYVSTKDLVNSLNWGLVYMKQSGATPVTYRLNQNLAVFHPPTGNWYIRLAADGALFGGAPINFGWNGTIPLAVDFDGNEQADFAVFWPDAGNWYIFNNAGLTAINWGFPGCLPVPGDYDGDRRTDFAVYYPPTGNWFILFTNGTTRSESWGWGDTIPVPADYDGDGRTDPAVYLPGIGNWYVLNSAGGRKIQNWGFAGGVPAPADYDGDRRADLAVYHPPSGYWFILPSNGVQRIQSWGFAGCVPAPADYDRDGKAEVAVVNTARGDWYFLYDNGQTESLNWGWNATRPVNNIYVINRLWGLLP